MLLIKHDEFHNETTPLRVAWHEWRINDNSDLPWGFWPIISDHHWNVVVVPLDRHQTLTDLDVAYTDWLALTDHPSWLSVSHAYHAKVALELAKLLRVELATRLERLDLVLPYHSRAVG